METRGRKPTIYSPYWLYRRSRRNVLKKLNGPSMEYDFSQPHPGQEVVPGLLYEDVGRFVVLMKTIRNRIRYQHGVNVGHKHRRERLAGATKANGS